jgi:hypothetical protein
MAQQEQDSARNVRAGLGSEQKGEAMSKQSELLFEVAEVLSGDRAKAYGSPYVNLHERTSTLWNAYIQARRGNPLDGVDVCNMMILLKIARIMENVSTKDNYADIAGYAGAAWEVSEEMGFIDALF